MRRCDYCGKQYSDKVSVCPADGQRTVNPQARSGVVFSAGTGHTAFNAKVVSPMTAAGGYRIFIQGSDLIFIQLESGSSQAINALIPILGAFGGLVHLFGWLFSRRKVDDFNERLNSTAPENLLRDSKKNFRLSPAEIRQAVIEPAAASSFGRKEVGRIALTIRQGEQLKLAFAERADMDAVWQLLASGFFAPLQAEVEWHIEYAQYLAKPAVKNIDPKKELH